MPKLKIIFSSTYVCETEKVQYAKTRTVLRVQTKQNIAARAISVIFPPFWIFDVIYIFIESTNGLKRVSLWITKSVKNSERYQSPIKSYSENSISARNHLKSQCTSEHFISQGTKKLQIWNFDQLFSSYASSNSTLVFITYSLTLWRWNNLNSKMA